MRTESRELPAVGIFAGKSRGFKSNLGDRIEMLLRRGRTFSPRASSSGVVASAVVLGGLMIAGSFVPRWIAFAQAAPAFEVASVKPSAPGTRGRSILRSPGGRFTATNAPLRDLVQNAYGVQDFQISGRPTWFNTERYDIVAKAEGDVSVAQSRLMLQTLLADRFNLALHRETKELPVYVLVVAKNGPKFSQSKPGESESDTGFRTSAANGPVTARKVLISEFAKVLSGELGRAVLDRTGLTGYFDFTFQWAPDSNRTPPGDGDGGRAVDTVPPPDTTGPSLFTAIQEQLGLKLEPSKGPVEILAIDHAEKPDAN
jgi:uncharacterized protein (TIGR03435 family)